MSKVEKQKSLTFPCQKSRSRNPPNLYFVIGANRENAPVDSHCCSDLVVGDLHFGSVVDSHYFGFADLHSGPLTTSKEEDNSLRRGNERIPPLAKLRREADGNELDHHIIRNLITTS